MRLTQLFLLILAPFVMTACSNQKIEGERTDVSDHEDEDNETGPSVRFFERVESARDHESQKNDVALESERTHQAMRAGNDSERITWSRKHKALMSRSDLNSAEFHAKYTAHMLEGFNVSGYLQYVDDQEIYMSPHKMRMSPLEIFLGFKRYNSLKAADEYGQVIDSFGHFLATKKVKETPDRIVVAAALARHFVDEILAEESKSEDEISRVMRVALETIAWIDRALEAGERRRSGSFDRCLGEIFSRSLQITQPQPGEVTDTDQPRTKNGRVLAKVETWDKLTQICISMVLGALADGQISRDEAAAIDSFRTLTFDGSGPVHIQATLSLIESYKNEINVARIINSHEVLVRLGKPLQNDHRGVERR